MAVVCGRRPLPYLASGVPVIAQRYRKAGAAVYAAVPEPVADDLSALLLGAAEMAEVLTALDIRKEDGVWTMPNPTEEPPCDCGGAPHRPACSLGSFLYFRSTGQIPGRIPVPGLSPAPRIPGKGEVDNV